MRTSNFWEFKVRCLSTRFKPKTPFYYHHFEILNLNCNEKRLFKGGIGRFLFSHLNMWSLKCHNSLNIKDRDLKLAGLLGHMPF